MEDTIKKRHWTLTVWLVFIIIANGLSALAYLLAGDSIQAMEPTLTPMVIVVFGICSGLNIIFAIAVFKWFKWGFWGFCVNTAIIAVISLLANLGISSVLSGMTGLIILYAFLHIGKEKKAWAQLK